MASYRKLDEINIQSRNERRKMNFSGSVTNFTKTAQQPSRSGLSYISQCPNCKNWDRIISYERKLKELIDEKEKLSKVNNYLMITVTRKDEILLNLMKENKNLAGEINSYKLQIKNLSTNQYMRHHHNSSSSSVSSSESRTSNKKVSFGKLRQSSMEEDSSKKHLKGETLNSSIKRPIKRSDTVVTRSKTIPKKFSTLPKSEEEGKTIDKKNKNDKQDKDEKDVKPFNIFSIINETITKNLENIEKRSEKIKRKLTTLNEKNEKLEKQEKLELNKEESKKRYFSNVRRLSKLNNQLEKVEKLLSNRENGSENGSRKNSTKEQQIVRRTSLKRNSIAIPGTSNLLNINMNVVKPAPPENQAPSLKHTNYYDKLLMMAKKNMNRKKEGNVRTSYLSMNEDFLKKLPKSDLLKEIYNLTLNDEDFVHAMRILPEEKLISYCDLIGNTIKDFEKAIKVIYRLKGFLRVSNKVYHSMTAEESCKIIIKNACEILDCDRSTIFTHDKFSNSLILHAGEGMGKSEVKVPVDKGIVGIVFSKGERIKLDDAYLDDRFNKDIDKKTNYRTRTILCVPLRDHEGNRMGVIQSINKRNGLFTVDDEEIMEIFANQASSILKTSMLTDEYFSFSSRLKSTIDFAIQLTHCLNLYDFTILNEGLLSSFFTINQSQILFYNKTKNVLVKVSRYEKVEKKCNFGIIGYVFNRKEMIGFNSVDESTYFNSVNDLEMGYPIITFPILSQNDEVLAIVQTAYPSKLNPKNSLPKDNDYSLLNYYRNICSTWIEVRKSLIDVELK